MKRLILFSIAVFILLLSCTTNPLTGEQEINLISEEQEVQMGAQSAGDFEAAFGGLVDDAAAQMYIDELGESLALVSDRSLPYSFGLLRSNVPNAFALPGGPVYVTCGLVAIMESDRELAAVIGHEIGHISAKHSVVSLSRQYGWTLLLEIAAGVTGSDNASSIGQLVAGITAMKYSRDDEYEADALGIRYMARAGFNPRGMVELLNSLDSLRSGPEGSDLEEMFSTHPLTGKRISAVKKIVNHDYSDAPADTPRPSSDFNHAKTLSIKIVNRQNQGE